MQKKAIYYAQEEAHLFIVNLPYLEGLELY